MIIAQKALNQWLLKCYSMFETSCPKSHKKWCRVPYKGYEKVPKNGLYLKFTDFDPFLDPVCGTSDPKVIFGLWGNFVIALMKGMGKSLGSITSLTFCIYGTA